MRLRMFNDELDSLEEELRRGPQLIYDDPEMQEAYENGFFDGVDSALGETS